MQNLKQQLRDELKQVTEERKIMLEQRGKDLEGSRTPVPALTPEPAKEEAEPPVTTPRILSPYHSQIKASQQVCQLH